MCTSTPPSEAPDPSLSPSASPSHWACQYTAWYPQFQRHALRSRVVTLPPAFVEYLLSDGVYLGDESKALFKAGSGPDSDSDDDHPLAVQDAESSSTSDSSEQRDWTELFPELHKDIADAIEELGGKVVPKLNWSCPTDAVWVNPLSTLACDNAEQVVLMLKSSDRVVHDLELLTAAHTAATSTSQLQSQTDTITMDGQHPAPTTTPTATLVLRKWYDLRPEREWRCFVRGGALVAISQRDPTQHFPQLCNPSHSRLESVVSVSGQDEDARQHGGDASAQQQHTGAGVGSDIEHDVCEVAAGPVAQEACELLQSFHTQYVANTFTLQDYTYDAYVATTNVIRLLDFNPVGGTTSPLLFTWEQLGLAANPDAEDGQRARAEAEPGMGHGLTAQLVNQEGQSALAGEGSIGDAQSEQTAVSLPRPGAGGGLIGRVGDVIGVPRIRLRVVPAAGFVQPGHRAACGMPFDMLGLQDSVDAMVERMQRGA